MIETLAALNLNLGGAGPEGPALNQKTNPYSRPGDKGKERNDAR